MGLLIVQKLAEVARSYFLLFHLDDHVGSAKLLFLFLLVTDLFGQLIAKLLLLTRPGIEIES